MARASLGSKPSVLRCSRCGKFVDWEDSRLQIVCGCRPHVQLPPVSVRQSADDDRARVRALFVTDFGRSKFIAFGEEFQAETVPAIVAEIGGDLAGALAYRLQQGVLQIVALATDPEWQRSGVGGKLVDFAEHVARDAGASHVAVATTNDNLPALYFYQRRGYRLTEVATDAIRTANDDAVIVGFAGIVIRDEFHLVKAIDPPHAVEQG